MICQYIDSRKEEFGVEPICTTLSKAGVQIAPSAYYARRSRSPSARSLRDEILKAEISKVYKDNYSVLGTRKIHVMLNRPEIAERHGAGHVARCTVERLMGDLGLRGVRRARSPRTTRSAPREQCGLLGVFRTVLVLCFRLPSSGPGNRFRPRSGCDTLGLSEDGHDCISARSTRQYR